MVEALALALNKNEDEYDRLPEAVRQYYSRNEWSWLSDKQKANLEQTETEPEC